MQIDNQAKIPRIIASTGFSIFVFPRDVNFEDVEITDAIIVEPEIKKNVSGEIKKEQVTNIYSMLNEKQSQDLTIIFKNAEKMNHVAANAFLKNLEEPKDNIHIAFFIHNLNQILPTIRSRAAIYRIKENFNYNDAPAASKKDLELAKSLLIADKKQLIEISEKLAKTKDAPRQKTLNILDLCIELAYKSFFKTSNPKWLKKLEQLTKAYENISNNGHIKLQLVANLISN